MKKVMIVLFLFLSFMVFALDYTPNLRLGLDFFSCPASYEGKSSGLFNTVNGGVTFGTVVKEFTFNGVISDSYFNINSVSNKAVFVGGDNTLSVLFGFFYMPVNWFELKSYTGIAWQGTSYNFDSMGVINKYKLGPAFQIDAVFNIKKAYTSIALINKLSILSQFNTGENDYKASDKVVPVFYGGVRFSFYPYIDWGTVFLEFGTQYWRYTSYPVSFDTVRFECSLGTSFDLKFPSKEINIIKLTSATVKPEKVKKVKKEDKRIAQLKKAEKGQSLNFSDIYFMPDSVEIKEESFAILDEIVGALKERPDLVIEVRGHTNSTGNKNSELTLSVNRAAKIVDYFVLRGIDHKNLRSSGAGSEELLVNTIEELNRRVELKVIDVISKK